MQMCIFNLYRIECDTTNCFYNGKSADYGKKMRVTHVICI